MQHLPVNRQLIEALYVAGLLSAEARRIALEHIHPHAQWAAWTARILMILGGALVLAGVMYFFAFNWARIPPLSKLGLIEFCILVTVGLAWWRGLKRLDGQLSLFGAAVLVGVFLAVFGQIYQTGADAWRLFASWSVLIFPWVYISRFGPLWAFWLGIVNLFIVLYWQQSPPSSWDAEALIYVWLALLNGAALWLREVLSERFEWLAIRWYRLLLLIAVLIILSIPTLMFIIEFDSAWSVQLGAAIGIIGHALCFYAYRWHWPDVGAMALTMLSIAITVETVSLKLLSELLDGVDMAAIFLLMGIVTLGIFAVALTLTRHMAREMEASYEPAA